MLFRGINQNIKMTFSSKTSDKILRCFDLAEIIFKYKKMNKTLLVRSKVTSYMQSLIFFIYLKMISARSKRRRILSLVFILKCVSKKLLLKAVN